MTILVTGAAGFVGYHTCLALLTEGAEVIGIDNLNAYYDPRLKQNRLDQLRQKKNFTFFRMDLCDLLAENALSDVSARITGIVHLAAQAGVRYSVRNPEAFVHSNVQGHVAVLEFARRLPRLKHLVYASSSSVYGRNTQLPFRETDRVDVPGSFYAVTKRSGELTAESYSHLYGLPQTGLRFFTIYGPWGRPDMAYYSFARAMTLGDEVTLYEGDSLARDFTYISDAVRAVLLVLVRPPAHGTARILNVGSDHPESVRHMVYLLEKGLGCKAHLRLLPRPQADVERTWACVERLHELTGWRSEVSFEEGLSAFTQWFRTYED
ncbi:NAD-dependent epimerase/dehydratase family protein [Acetobacter thailandicus]|uniref:NAD-dependent epimerase/dehydratase family protein n=1 Tax=Acetobacter thailandicus TaxID=1502842 RepID=UPI001BADACF2|nr:NAD-dependent epimerase/dehydratase family protein [Acetobacter thailandicus]